MFGAIINVLNTIPTGVYTVLAALLASWGVWISLRAHAERERNGQETAMRREVFFGAVEAISQADVYIKQFGNHNLSDAEHRKLIEDLGPRMAKLHIVGRLSTVKKFAAFTERFVEITIELGTDRAEMMDARGRLEWVSGQLTQLNEKRLEQWFGDSNIKVSPERWSEAEGKLSGQRNEGVEKLRQKSLELWQKSLKLASDLSLLEADAILATREDLKFPTKAPDFDEKEYREMMVGIWKRQGEKLDVLLRSLKKPNTGSRGENN